MTYKIAVVGCGKKKKENGKHKAKNLYTSLYSRLRMNYAEKECDEYWIFSAKHGIIEPDKMIEPYDQHISEVDDYDKELNLWTAITEKILGGYSGVDGHQDKEIVLLAGKEYCNAVNQRIEEDITVERPFNKTGGIGEQIKWLKDHTEDNQTTLNQVS